MPDASNCHALTDASLAALTACVPLLTGVLVEAGEEGLREVVWGAFVEPVLKRVEGVLRNQGWSYEVYARVGPELARWSLHLRTMVFTYLSLTLPSTPLPAPPSTAAFLATFPLMPPASTSTSTVDGVTVWARTAACIEQCDLLVALVGGGGWEGGGAEEVWIAVERRLIEAGQQGTAAGFTDVLVDLTSLAVLHLRWATNHRALRPPTVGQDFAAVGVSPMQMPLTPASFDARLAEILAEPSCTNRASTSTSTSTPLTKKLPALTPLRAAPLPLPTPSPPLPPCKGWSRLPRVDARRR